MGTVVSRVRPKITDEDRRRMRVAIFLTLATKDPKFRVLGRDPAATQDAALRLHNNAAQLYPDEMRQLQAKISELSDTIGIHQLGLVKMQSQTDANGISVSLAKVADDWDGASPESVFETIDV